MVQKKKTNKNILLRLCIFAFVVYAAVTLVDMQVTLAARKEELAGLKQTYQDKFVENKDLERQLAVGTDEEYIERVARDKLDYVYPGDRVFIDISGS